MRKIIIFLCLLLTAGICSSPSAHADDSNWTFHLAYHQATRSVASGNRVFVVANGNLYSYDLRNDEVRHFTPSDGMGSKSIVDIGYSDSHECLVVLYEDLHVDLLLDDGETFYGLPQIKNAGTSAGVPVSLFVGEEYAAIATSTGMGHIDLDQKAVCGFYEMGETVCAAAVFNGQLLLSTSHVIRSCPLTGNPYDRNAWETLQNGRVDCFATFAGQLYAGICEQPGPDALHTGLWLLNADGKRFTSLTDLPVSFMRVTTQKAVAGGANGLCLLHAEDPTVVKRSIGYKNTWTDCIPADKENRIWVPQGWDGLVAYDISGDTPVEAGRITEGCGPKRDYCYYLRYQGDRLLVAGGQLFAYGTMFEPTIMYQENNHWHFFEEDSIAAKTGALYRNTTGLAQDPSDPNHFFATATTGLYEFQDLRFVKHYTIDNSPLESALTSGSMRNYVLMSAPTYDRQGNLWMIDNQTDTLLRILKPDGSWRSAFIPGLEKAPTCENLMFDSKGRLWMTSRRSVTYHSAGVLCLDFNETVDQTDDDRSLYRSSLTNQDGTSYSLSSAYDIAEDRDGSIWIGSQKGVFHVTDPDEWFHSTLTVIQPKVPRNDGTNNADYLLVDVPVSAIAIDGGGRKWLGTTTGGVYLTNPDGSEILAHFDTSNSPILSNNIYDIAIHPGTGEVMIGTEKGLCSYKGYGSEPETELSKDHIKVYPNPVRPGYHGHITVAGLTDGAEVKVMSTGGQVVASGFSIGGSFVWDGRGLDGARVASGIYYFMISTADGHKGIAGKVVVI